MYNAALGLIYDFDPVKIVCFLLLNFIACGLIAKSIVTLNAGKTVSKTNIVYGITLSIFWIVTKICGVNMKKLFNYFLENKVSLLFRAFISAIFVFIDITLLKNSLFDKVLDKNFIDILIALVSLFFATYLIAPSCLLTFFAKFNKNHINSQKIILGLKLTVIEFEVYVLLFIICLTLVKASFQFDYIYKTGLIFSVFMQTQIIFDGLKMFITLLEGYLELSKQKWSQSDRKSNLMLLKH